MEECRLWHSRNEILYKGCNGGVMQGHNSQEMRVIAINNVDESLTMAEEWLER